MRILSVFSVLSLMLSQHLVTPTPVPKKYYGKFSRYTDYPENYAAWVPDDGGWLYHEHKYRPKPSHSGVSILGGDSDTSIEADSPPPNKESAIPPTTDPKPTAAQGKCELITSNLKEFGIRPDAVVCLDTMLTIDFLKSLGVSPQTSQVNGLMSSEEVAAKCDLIKANVNPLNIALDAVICLPNMIEIMLT